MRGHPGVKEHTDHKPRNALPGGLADELASARVARTQNNKTQRIHMFLCKTQQTGTSDLQTTQDYVREPNHVAAYVG